MYAFLHCQIMIVHMQLIPQCIFMDGESQHAAVHGIAELDTAEQLTCVQCGLNRWPCCFWLVSVGMTRVTQFCAMCLETQV